MIAERRWRIAIGGLAAILLAAGASHRISDNDFFWHLAYGRAFFEHHHLVVPEPLTIPELARQVLIHQWLWDAALYGVYARGGFAGVGLFVIALAAAAGCALAALVARWSTRPPRPLVMFSLVLVAGAIAVTRFNERPEMATAILWPCGLLLVRSLARVEGLGASLRRAIPLGLVALVWSQLHLSVMVFIAACAIVLVPTLASAGPGRRVRVGALVLVGGAGLVTPFTLANVREFSVAALIHQPVTPYTKAHIGEWKPLDWPMLDPLTPTNLQGPAFAVLALVGLAGVLLLGRRAIVEIGLALLGLFAVLSGRRGVFAAAYLMVPLAIETLEAAIGSQARRARLARGAAAIVALAFVVRAKHWLESDGPILRIGLDRGAFPTAAARWAETLPPGEHRALTTYRTGPMIAFTTRGHVRDFVDSRAPHIYGAERGAELHGAFDDTVLATANAIWNQPTLAKAAVDRFRFDIAVVERRYPVCDALAASEAWTPVVVEPAFTTFVRAAAAPDAPRIARLLPCGPAYLSKEQSCAADGELDAEIERLRAFVDEAFVRQLRADRLLRCSHEVIDGDRILASIPSADDAQGFVPARDALVAWLYARVRRSHEAVALLRPHVEAGEDWVVADALPSFGRGSDDDPAVRALLERVIEDQDASVNAALPLTLARVCMRMRDVDCVLRAVVPLAATGTIESAEGLCFTRAVGSPTQKQRADAWLTTLHVACGH